jgi:ankyrin repeat protein
MRFIDLWDKQLYSCIGISKYNSIRIQFNSSMSGEEQAVRAWLKKEGFQKNDLRSENNIYPYYPPMGHACRKGELNVCKWLHSHGAAEDITKAGKYGQTLMHIACREGHLSVCKWLFDVGAVADVSKVNDEGRTPMLCACYDGHLAVCKWLFEVGASADTTKGDRFEITPMIRASIDGHLSVCQWLYEMGAASDIDKADKEGTTPMQSASANGHLPVCKWLFEKGADITSRDNDGWSPMYCACRSDHLEICQWLVLNGAVNVPEEEDEQAVVEQDEDDDHNVGHVDIEAFLCDTTPHIDDHGDGPDSNFGSEEPNEDDKSWFPRIHPRLLVWAQDVVASNHTFVHVVLRASVIVPASHQLVSPSQQCHLPRLPRHLLQHVADFLNVERGRRLRNVREVRDILEMVDIDYGDGNYDDDGDYDADESEHSE